jgi:hypothetical protein
MADSEVVAGSAAVRSAARVVAAPNSFYLLSALSMLVGCLLLSHALAPAPGQVGKLLLLLGVLNLYEGLVIGLALHLIVRHRNARDGGTLLWLEALFLADTTFLGSEIYASDLGTGALVGASLMALALIKLGVISRVLRVPLGATSWFALVPLGFLLAVPGVFAAMPQSDLLRLPIVYLFWWVLAGVVVAQAVVDRRGSPGRARSPEEEGAAALRAALALLAPASLGLHLVGAGFAQGVMFFGVVLGPPLLALGVRSLLGDAPERPSKGTLVWPILALLASLDAPTWFFVSGPGDSRLTPLRLALVATGLTYALASRMHRSRGFGLGASLCLLSAIAGHSVSSIASSLVALLRNVLSWPVRLVPRTVGQWGALSVALSFLLLAVGAARSLRGPRGPEPRAPRREVMRSEFSVQPPRSGSETVRLPVAEVYVFDSGPGAEGSPGLRGQGAIGQSLAEAEDFPSHPDQVFVPVGFHREVGRERARGDHQGVASGSDSGRSESFHPIWLTSSPGAMRA